MWEPSALHGLSSVGGGDPETSQLCEMCRAGKELLKKDISKFRHDSIILSFFGSKAELEYLSKVSVFK